MRGQAFLWADLFLVGAPLNLTSDNGTHHDVGKKCTRRKIIRETGDSMGISHAPPCIHYIQFVMEGHVTLMWHVHADPCGAVGAFMSTQGTVYTYGNPISPYRRINAVTFNATAMDTSPSHHLHRACVLNRAYLVVGRLVKEMVVNGSDWLRSVIYAFIGYAKCTTGLCPA